MPNLSNASKRDKKKDDELLSKMVSAKISSRDIKDAVRILASDCSILPHSHETLQKLREKHPSSPVDLSMPDPPSSTDLQSCYMVTREEIRILESAGEKWLEEKLNDLKRVMERIRNIDCHDAYFILKNCLSIPKLLYGLRSAPLFKLDAIHKFDITMRSFLQSLLNIKVSDDTWKQITMPVKLGGLGIRSVGDMAISAYGSSSHKCKPLVELCSVNSDNSGTDISYIAEAEDHWHSRFGFDASQRPKQLDSQGSWDGPVCDSILANLIGNSSSETEKARLLAISSDHASDWLNAIPISSLGLKMNNRQFKTACALRLGAEICQKHICNCGTSVNKDGIHGLSCKKSSGRHP